MTKIKIYLFAFIILAVCALAVTNYLNTQKVLKLRGDVTILRQEITTLKEINKALEKDNKELEQENKQLWKYVKKRRLNIE